MVATMVLRAVALERQGEGNKESGEEGRKGEKKREGSTGGQRWWLDGKSFGSDDYDFSNGLASPSRALAHLHPCLHNGEPSPFIGRAKRWRGKYL